MLYWLFMLAMDLLVPACMIGFGKRFLKSAPQKINPFFGYRTTMSMKNQDTWTFAHSFCGQLWVQCGKVLLAASVIAMAGTEVLMSPVGMMMIHNPMTIAIGDSKEMQRAGEMLDEVKESIMNAYEIKTGMSRARISHLMDAESWFNAGKAVELGFADGVLHGEGTEDSVRGTEPEGVMFSRMAVTNSLLSKLIPEHKETEKKVPVEQLEKRLQLLSH